MAPYLRSPAIILVLLFLRLPEVSAQVPGAVYTQSGYDNAGGEDAICWSAPAFHNHTAVEQVLGADAEHDHDDGQHASLTSESFNGINWESDLVPSFVAGPTTMLPACPVGTSVHVDIIPEQAYGSSRLRTKRLYTYHVTGTVDLASIRKEYELSNSSFFFSSDGLHDIGLRIDFCPVNGNLCSPFVLERGEALDGQLHDGDHNHEDQHDDEEEEHHDEEEEHHDDEHRDRRRVLYSSRIRATQIVAFNITFDEPEEANYTEGDHLLDEEENHDGANHTEGDHLDEDEHEDEHHDEDDGHDRDYEDEGDQHDDHDHAEDHEGHSLDTEENHLKHLSSPLFLIPVDITDETLFEFHIDVDVEVNVPGNYLPLASLEFFLSNETIHGHAVGVDSDAAFKFDVANLLHQRAVFFYYERPNIQTVSTPIEILSYVIIGVAGTCQLCCLCATVYHRGHSVMKLSQGSFLVMLQIAGIITTACSFLYNPKSDAYCILQSPLTLIPLQFMFAVVFGRLRRIIRIMEPLMNWNRPQSSRNAKSGLKAWKQSLMNRNASWSSSSARGEGSRSSLKGSKASSQSSGTGEEDAQTGTTKRALPLWWPKTFCRASNIRQQFTARQLWIVIIIVTLPIVVLEAVGLALFRPELTLDMNADESIGRFECGTHEEQTYFLSSTAVLLLTIFLCLFEAQRSRRLPGLFNEAASVSFALLSSLLVGGLGFAVILVSGDPSADPNAPYIMEVILVSYIATILVIRLTVPKLQLIWKGEKVVIANMIAEHRKSQEAKTESSLHGVSGLSGSFKPTPSGSLEPLDKLESGASRNDTGVLLEAASSPTIPSISETDKSVTFDESANKRIPDSPIASHAPEPRTKDPLIIRVGQEPPDRLMFRVLKHSNAMSRVNERLLSGLQVDRDDWESVKSSLDELHGLLNDVEYR